MEGGASIVQSAVDTFGHIDGVVTVAGILRERMFFNMVEDEWDPVIETHLKGTFTVFRAAAPLFKEQKSGSFVAFTSGAFAGSVAQANYAAAKGGIVSLARSVAAGHVQVRRPVQRRRPGGEEPDVGQRALRHRDGRARGRRADGGFLLSDRSKDVTGQIYTANGGKIAVWNQPVEVREMRTDGRWTHRRHRATGSTRSARRSSG